MRVHEAAGDIYLITCDSEFAMGRRASRMFAAKRCGHSRCVAWIWRIADSARSRKTLAIIRDMTPTRIGRIARPITIKEFEARFPTEEACLDYLVAMRWKVGVRCPRCDNAKVYKLAKPYRWQCKKCAPSGYRFPPTARTIFDNSNVKLKLWFRAIFMMCASKKGVSALQIHRTLGTGSYETAWYMCHRIRAAMKDGAFRLQAGEIEVDETYIGGKPRNRHGGEREPKTAIIGAIARKGSIIAKVINDTTNETMQGFVKRAVGTRISLLATDEHPNYRSLKKDGYKHEFLTHRYGQYVKEGIYGAVRTANLDSFWSLLKRGIVGTFRDVSRDYLGLYVNEFAFRHNNREHGDMFGLVARGC